MLIERNASIATAIVLNSLRPLIAFLVRSLRKQAPQIISETRSQEALACSAAHYSI